MLSQFHELTQSRIQFVLQGMCHSCYKIQSALLLAKRIVLIGCLLYTYYYTVQRFVIATLYQVSTIREFSIESDYKTKNSDDDQSQQLQHCVQKSNFQLSVVKPKLNYK